MRSDVGPLFGYAKTMPGNTQIVNEMFNREQSIHAITDYLRDYGMTGERKILPDKPSQSMERAANARLQAMGLPVQKLPPESFGIGHGPATNPLFTRFAAMLDARMRRAPSKGGTGLPSILERYRSATKDIQELRDTDPGNQVTWLRKLEAKPTVMRALSNANVDHTNPTAVKNFLERYRQDMARAINTTITGIENEISQAVGRPIKIEDLQPYATPQQ